MRCTTEAFYILTCMFIKQVTMYCRSECPETKDHGTLRMYLARLGHRWSHCSGVVFLYCCLTLLMRCMCFWCVRHVWINAFELLKLAITNSEVLQIPSSKSEHPLEILIDASKVAVGAVMLQDQGKGMRPCVYLSKRLADRQTSWGPYELELFGLTHTFHTWKPYLIGREFVVRTDHSPLKYYHSQERLTDKMVRQLDFLSEFRFKVHHMPGKDNTVSDGLSRRPDHYLNQDG